MELYDLFYYGRDNFVIQTETVIACKRLARKF